MIKIKDVFNIYDTSEVGLPDDMQDYIDDDEYDDLNDLYERIEEVAKERLKEPYVLVNMVDETGDIFLFTLDGCKTPTLEGADSFHYDEDNTLYSDIFNTFLNHPVCYDLFKKSKITRLALEDFVDSPDLFATQFNKLFPKYNVVFHHDIPGERFLIMIIKGNIPSLKNILEELS